MNIVEEPHFAMYRALRDPSAKNILGLIGVGLMTGVTVTAKNFVDGTKEAWIKKQECNINYQLQEDLISVAKALSHMVVVRVEQSLEIDIKNGKKVKLSVNEEIVFVINENEDPIAILEKVEENI